MNANSPVSLPEEDCLKVIDIIRRLYRCETRDHLDGVLKESVFPLFNVQSLGSSWTDIDLNQQIQGGKLLYSLGYGREEGEIWQQVYPYQKDFTRLFATSLRPVLAYDVDLPRSNLKAALQGFLTDHPQYNKPEFESFHTITSFIGMVDPPDFNIGIGLARFQPHEEPFTPREVRMAELIGPSLIRALKFIAINEELKTYRSLVDTLAQVSTPLALVHPQGLIAFCNEAFQKITGRRKGEFLPEEFTALLKQKEEALNAPEIPESPTDPLAFFKFPGGDFRFSWTRLSRPGTSEDGCWLLKMKPVVDPYSQTLFAMSQAGLTPRETEVASRVCDGFEDTDIAQRLFISLQTVKNHLKNIYKKLDVHSRTQLVARLRPSSEEREG